ncbi:MAG: Crp/Fnr family transcriptional regulator [Acidobacteria bacterium]|nr:MAG: Crp/Fnr family transcriptional regulator [Acidobacteriota bacterium]REK08708.1 MAG: Crp/Fnr family transcriptional regulator [Acidobacteriota bacterium]
MCRACAQDHRAALSCRERIGDYLARLPLLSHLAPEEVEELTAASCPRELCDGQWLFAEGEPADRFFLVRAGQIVLFRQSADGRECIVAVVGQDELLGEEQIFDEHPVRSLNARAVGPTALLSISRNSLRRLVDQSPTVRHAFLQTIDRRQRLLLDHIERLTLQNAQGRLVAYLLGEAKLSPDGRRVRLRIPKHALASHLAIQPETLSRVMSRLKASGKIREERGSMLLDTARLREDLEPAENLGPSWGCPGPPPGDDTLRRPGR